ncbi:MAG: transposase [Candidatus Omnitrophica bacterium]|nr:transposase [Candidatus Omnitrophota bacterium]
MERKKTRHFDKDFKISAVKMASEEGSSIAEVARSLGITPTLLYNWKKKYADDGNKAFIGKGHLTELAALRKKLRRSELENEILKKAVGIFSKEDQDGLDL